MKLIDGPIMSISPKYVPHVLYLGTLSLGITRRGLGDVTWLSGC